MSDLLRVLPVTDTKTPVRYVCFHPIAAGELQNGITHNEFTGEKYEPDCLANEYEYDSVLQEVCAALGWQGGTIHQAVEEIKKLKIAAQKPDAAVEV
jgi:hypothetical protein